MEQFTKEVDFNGDALITFDELKMWALPRLGIKGLTLTLMLTLIKGYIAKHPITQNPNPTLTLP